MELKKILKEPFETKRNLMFIGAGAAALLVAVIMAVVLIFTVDHVDPTVTVLPVDGDRDTSWDAPDYVASALIPKNEYSRPGTPLETITGIVVHYVANPGTSAANNRSYFAGLAQSGATYASSHFIVGLEGEVLQCVPVDEVAYASNKRNADTLSIECCHPDETGVFTHPTYRSLVKLCADICLQFDLDPERDIIRHYDVTGKMCPLYFVEHEDEWSAFLSDVTAELERVQTDITTSK